MLIESVSFQSYLLTKNGRVEALPWFLKYYITKSAVCQAKNKSRSDAIRITAPAAVTIE